MIDELPDCSLRTSAYKVGEIMLADPLLSLIINLISAVATSKNSILAISLTEKQSLYERFMKKFKGSIRRF